MINIDQTNLKAVFMLDGGVVIFTRLPTKIRKLKYIHGLRCGHKTELSKVRTKKS